MRALFCGLVVSSALLLSGCDDETLADVEQRVEQEGGDVVLKSRVVFNPTEGDLSIPNDLLFTGTQDGTLNFDDLVEDKADYSDPQVALSAIDGWSTINPFKLMIDFPSGVTLEASSVTASSVRIFEVVMGGPLSPAPCNAIPSGIACQLVDELVFQQDFIATAASDGVAVIPLKPLKAKTTYIAVLTNELSDSNGLSVQGSATYELVQQDIAMKPLGSDSQLQLQAVINSFESIAAGAGVTKSNIIYSMAMTTQSTLDVVNTLKQLMVAPIAAGGSPNPLVVNDSGLTIAQALAANGVTLSPELQALYSTGNVYSGTLNLPYYLGIPSSTNIQAPVNTWWKALCDSGVMLAALPPSSIPSEPLSATDAACMAAGLRDLSSVLSIDTERNLTKFNPIPAPQTASDILYINHPGLMDVQMTVPNISALTDSVRASYGLPPLTEVPDAGWPVVVLQHGITSKKEDMLALTGILSAFGFATAAIDHPLHGSRGFDLDNDGTDDINATTVSATHYMNLANLLVTRDNLRQSTVDTVGLRLSLNAVVGAPINGQNVSFVGQSLGALTGINSIALANTEIAVGQDPSDALDSLFNFNTASLAMPGVGIGHFLMQSPSFEGLIKATLTLSLSPEFQALVNTLYPDGNYSEEEFVQAYQQFLSLLDEQQLAELNADFASFTIAAQSVIDAGDPVNSALNMAETSIPTLLFVVVGDGQANLPDQVIPNVATTSPLSGTEGAISLLALPNITSTTAGSGAVRFKYGHHGSLLSSSPQPNAPDAELTGRVTKEMQGQAVGYLLSQGAQITVTDSELIR